MPNLFANLRNLLSDTGDNASFEELERRVQEAYTESKVNKEKLFNLADLGLTLTFEKDHFVSICFHGSSLAVLSGEFEPYFGKLPFGIRFMDSQREVEAKIIVPPLTTELMPGCDDSASLDLWQEYRIGSVDMTCIFRNTDGNYRLGSVELSQYELASVWESKTKITSTELILMDSESRPAATLPIPSGWIADSQGYPILRPESGETALLSFKQYGRLRFQQVGRSLGRLDFIERFGSTNQPFNLIDVHEFNAMKIRDRYVYSMNGICDKMVPDGRFIAHYSFTEEQAVDDLKFHYFDGLWFVAQAPIFEKFKIDAEVVLFTAKWCAPLP